MVTAPTRCPDARLAVRGPERDSAYGGPAFWPNSVPTGAGNSTSAGPRAASESPDPALLPRLPYGSVADAGSASRVGQPEGVGAIRSGPDDRQRDPLRANRFWLTFTAAVSADPARRFPSRGNR